MKKAIEMMQKIQIAIGGFFLCIFLLTVVFQMLSRYFGIAATWTEDVSMKKQQQQRLRYTDLSSGF